MNQMQDRIIISWFLSRSLGHLRICRSKHHLSMMGSWKEKGKERKSKKTSWCHAKSFNSDLPLLHRTHKTCLLLFVQFANYGPQKMDYASPRTWGRATWIHRKISCDIAWSLHQDWESMRILSQNIWYSEEIAFDFLCWVNRDYICCHVTTCIRKSTNNSTLVPKVEMRNTPVLDFLLEYLIN